MQYTLIDYRQNDLVKLDVKKKYCNIFCKYCFIIMIII
jgi:hypothetical protein